MQKQQNVSSQPTAAMPSRKGMTISLAALVSEAAILATFGREHAAVLEARGWTPADAARLEEASQAVTLFQQMRQLKRREAELATVVVAAEATEARHFRNELVAGLKLGAARGLAVSRGNVSGSVRSVVELRDWLVRARLDVARFALDLAQVVPNPLKRLDRALENLSGAVKRQKEAQRAILVSTLELRQKRDALVGMLERLRLTVQAASVRDPALRMQFRRRGLTRRGRRMSATQPAAANDDEAAPGVATRVA
jgi:hypothetical protein